MDSHETLFRTPVEVPCWDKPMLASGFSLFLGSCFAQQMGQRFLSYGLRAVCNPLGVVYNPESIALQLQQAFQPEEAPLPIFMADAEWRCWSADTMIGGPTEEACRRVMQGALALLRESILQADQVFITLGTNVCYRLKSNGMIVCNCHRVPQAQFEEDRLTLDECTEALRRIVDLIREHRPEARIVFTVSPYRYAKYGMHGSQLAKATLLLAVDQMCHEYSDVVSYFPAYEIVMDELRDYRFYAEDMIHPSSVAVDYIWSRLVATAMGKQMQAYLKEYEPIRRFHLHRPNNPDSNKYKQLLEMMQQQEIELKHKYNV